MCLSILGGRKVPMLCRKGKNNVHGIILERTSTLSFKVGSKALY